MSLAEYEELLVDMIARDKLTLEQAQQLRQMFMNGEIREDDLPLPLEQAIEKDDRGIVYFGRWSVPGRMFLESRKKFRDRAMRTFDMSMTEISDLLHNRDGYGVSRWHTDAIMYLSSGMLANWMYGNGTDAEPNIDQQIDEQLTYLYRFAGEQSAMSLLGTPFSERETVNRSLLYGGAVWASWFYGNESVSYDDGYVAQYIAVDDGRTCNPCRQAVGYYRINEGVMPGQVCYGGSRCRCERRIIYAPEILARL